MNAQPPVNLFISCRHFLPGKKKTKIVDFGFPKRPRSLTNTPSKAYSPNSDPANIRLGYTTDAYSKGMVRALKVGGFDVKTTRKGDAPKMTPGGSTPRPGGGGVSPSGTTPSGTTPKKPHKFGSGIAALTGTNPFVSSGGSAPPGPPMSSFQALQNPAPKSSTSQGSGNSSATQVPNQNQFPSIDANAMISREKIKVLGLTVA